MANLPSNWRLTTLGEVAKWGSGGTPNRSISEYYGGSIPWFKTGELNDGIVTEAEEFLTEKGLKDSSAKLFPKGSIMIAMYGATIGKCAILGVDGSTNQACAVAQPNDGIEPQYLFHYLRSQKQDFIEKGKGGAQPNISQTVIKEHPFPLAPLPEQKRIVAKLDTLFGHLHQLKARLENIPTLLRQFRQAVLTQAVTGKLTEEWRKGKSLSWMDTTIGEISSLITKGASPKWQGINYVNEYNNESVLFITSENVDRFRILEDKFKYLEISFNELQKRSILKRGDVLTNIVGGSIGRTAVWNSDLRANINQAVCVIRPHTNQYLPEYLTYYLNSDIGLQSLFSDVVDVARANISLENIRNTKVSVPCIEEQREIILKVESLFAVAKRIETSYRMLQEKVDQLPQAILAKAFQGELQEPG